LRESAEIPFEPADPQAGFVRRARNRLSTVKVAINSDGEVGARMIGDGGGSPETAIDFQE
jgi:hypothetical protein